MITIRLIDLTILSTDKLLTFQSFLLKVFWMIFPILPVKSKRNEWPIKDYSILIVIKLLTNHWIYRWSISCERRVSYGRILMFYISLMTISYIFDVEIILVRILTRNKYTLESLIHFPIFSLSLREFWGQRYNRVMGTILKESIFEPVRSKFSSSLVEGLVTFTVSGLLHVHNAYIVFDNNSFLCPTFMFFFLNGIGCFLEANMKIQLPVYIRWLSTHTFLLLTSSLLLEPSLGKGSPYTINNPPPSFNIEWIPKLPIPKFCP